jgi:O-acetyl-ADP-ribose deacetylase (regulator of RNase III)
MVTMDAGDKKPAGPQKKHEGGGTMEKILSGVVLECVEGDIAAQADMTAVVNAANAQLRMGGGVAGAIHRAAGPGLEAECRPLAPIRPGEAVLTGGHRLPNRYVIHCLGPVWGKDRPEKELLASCYRRALELAEEHGIDSVAFPAISTGIFGYPLDEAAGTALETIREIIPGLRKVKRIRFVLHGREALSVHEKHLEKLFG